MAARSSGQLRCRWNGISKTAANARAAATLSGTASASVAKNAPTP
jgi:hypothetical protein